MTKRSQHRLRHGDGWIETRPTATGELRYLARWTVRQPDGTFAKRSKSFRSEAEAERYLHEVMDRGWRDAPPENPLVRELVASWLARGAYRWKPATLATYRQRAKAHVLPALGALPIAELTTPRVQRWIDGLAAATLDATTIDAACRVLSGVCKDAVRLGIIPANPVTDTRRPAIRLKPIATWNAAEVQAVMRAVADEPMWLALYRLALSTGMRPGELRALRWSDLDLDRRRVTVARTITKDAQGRVTVGETTKTGTPRAVAMTASTVATLLAWRTAQKRQRLAASHWQEGDYVFTTKTGAYLPLTSWQHRHDALIAATGVRPITLHGLRHTNATAELEAGTHPLVVANRLGHAKVETTINRYQHVSDTLQRAAIEALEERLFGDEDATTSAR